MIVVVYEVLLSQKMITGNASFPTLTRAPQTVEELDHLKYLIVQDSIKDVPPPETLTMDMICILNIMDLTRKPGLWGNLFRFVWGG